MISSSARIDPTARVEDGASIGDEAEIGPFCVVGAGVELAARVKLVSHVVVSGITSIGEGTIVYPFASLGSAPQSYHYKGEASRLKIGSNNIIREHVTMNTGTAGGHMETVVGDNGMFMVGSHVAHDCIVGNNAIFANNATLAGHCVVGNHVFMGGLAGTHQFVKIGDEAMIGGMVPVRRSIIPFGAIERDAKGLGGLNLIGLKRRGHSRTEINAIRAAYHEIFYGSGTFEQRLERVAVDYAEVASVIMIIDFIRDAGKRRIFMPHDASGMSDLDDAA